MINKEKLIKDLEDRFNNHEYYINVNSLLIDLKRGYYDEKCIDMHEVDKFYTE